MDLTFGTEELAFQQEVRSWLKENLTPEIMGESKVARNAYMPQERLLDWQKRLAKKGWLCTGWPKEFGGPGFSTTQKYIFEMELAQVVISYFSLIISSVLLKLVLRYLPY